MPEGSGAGTFHSKEMGRAPAPFALWRFRFRAVPAPAAGFAVMPAFAPVVVADAAEGFGGESR